MIFWQEHIEEIEKAMSGPNPKTYNQLAEIFSHRFNEPVNGEQVRAARRRAKKGYASAQVVTNTSRSLFDSTDLATNIPTQREVGTVIKTQPTPREFPDAIRFSTHSVCVIADLHVPYHNARFLGRVFDMMNRFGCRDLVIAGDYTNQASLHRHPKNEVTMPLRKELMMGGQLLLEMGELLGSRRNLWMTNGNHDERVSKTLDTEFQLGDLVNVMLNGKQMQCGLTVTDRDYLHCDVNRVPWTFGHFERYNKRGGEIARRLCEKYQSNVAGGHDHIQGFSLSECGKFLAISIGSMIDTTDGSSPFYYQERRLNTFKNIQNGILIVHDGEPHLFDEYGSTALNGRRPWSHFYE